VQLTITVSTQFVIWRWPWQNTFGMWTVLYWIRSSRTQFGVSINVWRLAGDTLNITCNFLYCNHQVHRDFLIALYNCIYWIKTNQIHISFKIIKFYFTLCCSTCFGHRCVHHQEPLIAAHEVSGHRVVLGRLFPPALFCCYSSYRSNNRTRLQETTDPTPHGDQRLHVQQ
jgi:hypothetical protein